MLKNRRRIVDDCADPDTEVKKSELKSFAIETAEEKELLQVIDAMNIALEHYSSEPDSSTYKVLFSKCRENLERCQKRLSAIRNQNN